MVNHSQNIAKATGIVPKPKSGPQETPLPLSSPDELSLLTSPNIETLLEHGADTKKFALVYPTLQAQFTFTSRLGFDTGEETLGTKVSSTISGLAVQFIGVRKECYGKLYVPEIHGEAVIAAALFLEKMRHVEPPKTEEARKCVAKHLELFIKALTQEKVPFESDFGKTAVGMARNLTILQHTSLLEDEYLRTGTIQEGHSPRLDRVREQAAKNMGQALANPFSNLQAIEALCLAKELSARGAPVEPLDFARTRGLHTFHLPGELPYRVHALRLFAAAIERDKKIDTSSKEGRKKLFRYFTREGYEKVSVTPNGGKINIIVELAYPGQRFHAIQELVSLHPDFNRFEDIPVLPITPNGTWKDTRGNPSRAAKNQVAKTIRVLAGREPDDSSVWSKNEFQKVLPLLTVKHFRSTATNNRGTTSKAVLDKAYGDSSARAVLDVVHSLEEFRLIKAIGLTEFDIPAAAKGLWTKDGVPTPAARYGVHLLLLEIGKSVGEGLDPRKPEDFYRIRPDFVGRNLSTPIGPWQRDFSGVMSRVYGNSPDRALKDLALHTKEYAFLCSEFT